MRRTIQTISGISLLAMCLLATPVTAIAGESGSAGAGAGSAATASWELTDGDGNAWSPDTTRGNVVVLEFWATWCKTCVMNLPEVGKLAADYSKAPVKVLAVNIRETGDAAAVLREAGIDVALALEGDKVAKAFDVKGTPTAIVLDSAGQVALRVQGGGDGRNDSLRETIDRLLTDM